MGTPEAEPRHRRAPGSPRPRHPVDVREWFVLLAGLVVLAGVAAVLQVWLPGSVVPTALLAICYAIWYVEHRGRRDLENAVVDGLFAATNSSAGASNQPGHREHDLDLAYRKALHQKRGRLLADALVERAYGRGLDLPRPIATATAEDWPPSLGSRLGRGASVILSSMTRRRRR